MIMLLDQCINQCIHAKWISYSGHYLISTVLAASALEHMYCRLISSSSCGFQNEGDMYMYIMYIIHAYNCMQGGEAGNKAVVK